MGGLFGTIWTRVVAAVDYDSRRRKAAVGVASIAFGVLLWWAVGTTLDQRFGLSRALLTLLRYGSILGTYVALSYLANYTSILGAKDDE